MKISCQSRADDEKSSQYSVSGSMTVAELVKFDVKQITFKCEEDICEEVLQGGKDSESQSSKTYDAFQMLMTGGRKLPTKKTG